MKRNPDATCATCPYWKDWRGKDNMKDMGFCCVSHIYERKEKTDWCGQHPDFELKKPESKLDYDFERELCPICKLRVEQSVAGEMIELCEGCKVVRVFVKAEPDS